MSFLREDVFEIGTPGRNCCFNQFLLLGDFSGNGGLSDGFPVQPLLSFLDEIFDFMVGVQTQTLKKVVLGFTVLVHFGEALTKRLSVPKGREFVLREENGSTGPINFWVPLLKPRHSEDELGFSEV